MVKYIKLRILEYLCIIGIIVAITTMYQPMPQMSGCTTTASPETILIPIATIILMLWLVKMLVNDLDEPKK